MRYTRAPIKKKNGRSKLHLFAALSFLAGVDLLGVFVAGDFGRTSTTHVLRILGLKKADKGCLNGFPPCGHMHALRSEVTLRYAFVLRFETPLFLFRQRTCVSSRLGPKKTTPCLSKYAQPVETWRCLLLFFTLLSVSEGAYFDLIFITATRFSLPSHSAIEYYPIRDRGRTIEKHSTIV